MLQGKTGQGFVHTFSTRQRIARKQSDDKMRGNPSTSVSFGKIGAFIFVLFLFFFLSSVNVFGGGSLGGEGPASLRTWRPIWGESSRKALSFAIVADLDRQSKVKGSKNPTWKSYFKRGLLIPSSDGYDLQWGDEEELTSQFGEAGRGLELSELVSFGKQLLTFDDRSGIVFEITKNLECIPRNILMEGDGNQAKGQKTEWATVKDGKLYVGSFGKPFTNGDEIVNHWNLWVSIIDGNGVVSHEDWTDKYALMQEVTKSSWPGYMIHEAIHWDDVHRVWYVLPRRVSSAKYDEKEDESMGSNLVLVFDETISKLVRDPIEIGEKVPTHGWSSFKFLPHTRNNIIVGLRTMEIENKATGDGSQNTFITVFDIEGNVLLRETMIPGDRKYEGIEFL